MSLSSLWQSISLWFSSNQDSLSQDQRREVERLLHNLRNETNRSHQGIIQQITTVKSIMEQTSSQYDNKLRTVEDACKRQIGNYDQKISGQEKKVGTLEKSLSDVRERQMERDTFFHRKFDELNEEVKQLKLELQSEKQKGKSEKNNYKGGKCPNKDIDDGDDNRGDLSNDTRRAVKEIADILKTFGERTVEEPYQTRGPLISRAPGPSVGNTYVPHPPFGYLPPANFSGSVYNGSQPPNMPYYGPSPNSVPHNNNRPPPLLSLPFGNNGINYGQPYQQVNNHQYNNAPFPTVGEDRRPPYIEQPRSGYRGTENNNNGYNNNKRNNNNNNRFNQNRKDGNFNCGNQNSSDDGNFNNGNRNRTVDGKFNGSNQTRPNFNNNDQNGPTDKNFNNGNNQRRSRSRGNRGARSYTSIGNKQPSQNIKKNNEQNRFDNKTNDGNSDESCTSSVSFSTAPSHRSGTSQRSNATNTSRHQSKAETVNENSSTIKELKFPTRNEAYLKNINIYEKLKQKVLAIGIDRNGQSVTRHPATLRDLYDFEEKHTEVRVLQI